MTEKKSDKWVSLTLSVLVHGTIVALLVWGFLLYKRDAKKPEVQLAIEATIVDPKTLPADVLKPLPPTSREVRPPAPEPAPPEPVPEAKPEPPKPEPPPPEPEVKPEPPKPTPPPPDDAQKREKERKAEEQRVAAEKVEKQRLEKERTDKERADKEASRRSARKRSVSPRRRPRRNGPISEKAEKERPGAREGRAGRTAEGRG